MRLTCLTFSPPMQYTFSPKMVAQLRELMSPTSAWPHMSRMGSSTLRSTFSLVAPRIRFRPRLLCPALRHLGIV